MPAANTCVSCGRAITPGSPARDGLCGACRPPALAVTQLGLRRPLPPGPAPMHPAGPPVGCNAGGFSKGQAIGAYVVEELLGEGLQAAVYLVREPQQKRRMALKILHEDAPRPVLDRLENEAKALTRLRHSGVVRLIGAGTHAGRAYLVREYLPGRSLHQILEDARQGRSRRLSHAEMLSIWRQLAEALEALHGSTPSILHRNLMPAHVMLVRPLRAVLVGFGLLLAGSSRAADPEDRGVGTPARMSPEALDGAPLDERSDIFSVGLLMYELVTGICPGDKAAVPPWFNRRNEWSAPSPRRWDPALPEAMQEAVLRCLEVDQSRRCRNAGELLRLLYVPPLQVLLPVGQLPAQRITDEPEPDRTAAPVVSAAKPPAELLARLTHFEVEELLSSDSGGETFLARHRDRERRVVIRMLQVPADPAARARLGRRIEELAGLNDSRIVPLLDSGYAGNHAFLVLEHVAGQELSRVLEKRGILPVDEALAIFADLLEALRVCHANGVVHQNLSPDCVLVEPDGSARLTSFRIDARAVRSQGTNYSLDDRTLQTSSYLTPEEVAGDALDARSDLYQCGLVLYEMLAGKRATTGRTLDEVYDVVLKKVPTPLRMVNPECPANLTTMVQNVLEKRSAGRYQSAVDVQRALAAVRAGAPVARHKGRPV